MIAAIRGILLCKTNKLVLETASGLAYEVEVPKSLLPANFEIGSTLHLYTSLIVREQEMSLIGFLSYEEKLLFELLLTAKGVGPKQALKFFEESSPQEFCSNIASANIHGLSKIKGISAKKAEQLIFDLQEKMKKFLSETLKIQQVSLSSTDNKRIEICLALRTLGYADNEIKKQLDMFLENRNLDEEKTETLVSEFLLVLAKL